MKRVSGSEPNGSSLPLPADDLERRKPVWHALGEFFLDGEADLNYIARDCAASPFSLDQLDEILVREVWATLRFNEMLVAGQWGYWDDVWLVERILAAYPPKSSLFGRLFWGRNPSCWKEWLEVRRDIQQRRSSPPDAGEADLPDRLVEGETPHQLAQPAWLGGWLRFGATARSVCRSGARIDIRKS